MTDPANNQISLQPIAGQHRCAACGAEQWTPLPMPRSGRSMTTAGRFVDAPLGKAQCQNCGAIQKVYEKRLADTDFYEKAYTYYSRPGSEKFDQVRYEALANWIISALPGLSPRRVLDIGCGRGWTISALKAKLPEASYVGLEPTLDAVALAQTNGLDVRQGRLGGPELQGEKFDLIYSNNVLQHTTDPVAFLEAQIPLLADGGTIVLSCPDGSVPSVELMMADQNFSYSPRHLAAVCAKAGLTVEKWLPCPGGPLRHEQLVVLSKRPQGAESIASAAVPQEMADPSAFVRYLEAWNNVDDFLSKEIAGKRRVFNFGGGLWSYVLAAYCPRYWHIVECCLVDGFSGMCMDKQVVPTEQIALGTEDIVVLGTNPYVQDRLVKRFAEQGIRAVSWNHLIPD